MGKFRQGLAAWVLIGMLGGAATAFAAEAPKPDEKKPAKDLVLKGDAVCTSCHDEEDSPKQLAIGKTRHGTVADKNAPTCTSCHGPSENHIHKLEGQKDRAKPDITFGGMYAKVDVEAQVDTYFGRFGKGTTTAVKDRNEVCLSCHKGGKRIHWAASTHANRDVACTNCHQIHTAHDRVRDRKTQTELCFTCHKDKRAESNRPSHHPVPEGKMACSDCHNVHGSNPKQLARGTVNETCYQCHMEKRGPFLHNHQPVNEECTLCHNPHGTTIGAMLKARPPFLCQECHNDISSGHPGQLARLPGSPTTSTSSLGTVGRGCLNCHTNIHGDNNPQGSTATRRFFR